MKPMVVYVCTCSTARRLATLVACLVSRNFEGSNRESLSTNWLTGRITIREMLKKGNTGIGSGNGWSKIARLVFLGC